MLQDGWYQCPICDRPMFPADYESHGMCNFCQLDFAQNDGEWRVDPTTGNTTTIYDEELEIGRMIDEGGLAAGECPSE
jgi:hypothetical protein